MKTLCICYNSLRHRVKSIYSSPLSCYGKLIKSDQFFYPVCNSDKIQLDKFIVSFHLFGYYHRKPRVLSPLCSLCVRKEQTLGKESVTKFQDYIAILFLIFSNSNFVTENLEISKPEYRHNLHEYQLKYCDRVIAQSVNLGGNMGGDGVFSSKTVQKSRPVL